MRCNAEEQLVEEAADEHHELVQPQLVDAAPLAQHRGKKDAEVLPRHLHAQIAVARMRSTLIKCQT